MYSQKTGMVRRELLEDKLNQEIKRSASFDQDLILVIFSLKGLDTPGNLSRFQSMVFESFPYRDLVFDYTDKSYALIIPNLDIESVVPVLERFQAKMDRAGFAEPQRFRAGASSRCGRLVTAHRLLTETRSAYRKTLKNSAGGIVLFKISPQKYRAVIAEKNY
jgi:hypothetical protein